MNRELMLTNMLSKPAIQRLEAWMKEVTDLLCYQPSVPMDHKTEIVNAMVAFQVEIAQPGKQSGEIDCPGCGKSIDPDVCWCGDLKKNHDHINGDHLFVPLGCDCLRKP